MIKKFKTEPCLIEVSDSNKIVFHLVFFTKYKKSDTANRKIMNRILSTCNENIENSSLFNKKLKELFIIDYNISSTIFNDTCLIYIDFVVPKIGVIEKFSLDETLRFLHDSIFNPLIEKNRFNEEHFIWEKDYLYNQEKEFPNSIYQYAFERVSLFFDENKEMMLYHDEYLKQLNDVTSESVYNYYLENIKNKDYITYIYGNLDDRENILNTYNKYFGQDKSELEIDINYFNFLKLKEYKEKEETIKYRESVLNLIYQVDNINEKDLLLIDILYFFLHSKENNLIFHNLRNKHNLIYNSNVVKSSTNGIICIQAFLNKDDISQVFEIIEKTINDIKIKDNFELYMERLIKAIQYDLLDTLDNLYSAVNKKINKDLNWDYALDEKLDLIKKVTFYEFNTFLDRLKLVSKYTMIAGDKHEES